MSLKDSLHDPKLTHTYFAPIKTFPFKKIYSNQDKGRIDLDELQSVLRKDTSLVSVMTVNNEIGVVQPIKEIGEMCRKNKVIELDII